MPPIQSSVASASFLAKSLLRSKANSRRLSDQVPLQGKKSGPITIPSYSFSGQNQYSFHAPRTNNKIQTNLNFANVAVAQQRSYSTSVKKDRYGRILRRRVIVTRDRSSNRKPKTKSSTWPKLPKIITPINVPLQPIQPPPNLKVSSKNLNLGMVGNQQSGKSVASSSSSTAAVAAPGTKTTITSAAKTLTNQQQQQLISKEKQMMSAMTIPPTVKTKKFRKWLVENSGTIILNIGSLCTLTAFTRVDSKFVKNE